MNIEADVRESLAHLKVRTGTDTEKFRFLGSGLYRRAWLHRESGKVIKVGDARANRLEVDNSQRLRDEPSLEGKVRIPEVRHLMDLEYGMSVIMAEFVDGKPTICARYGSWSMNDCDCGYSPCHADAREEMERLTEIGDLHYDNVFIKDDEYWIVDLGDG